MFRRVATSFSRIIVGAAGVQLGATAIALSDKELSKKPEWYQNAVRSLEYSIIKLSKYGYIQSQETLDEAHEVLLKVADVHSTEIHWRLARVLIEKAELTKCGEQKKHLLHEAKEHAKKALAVEPSKGCAGAHKWQVL
uniref:TPR_REGION domain-containing protein n=1 Tax=Heterorhabditis bacteriophora TaxID=37862 RepID=A0A1I7XLL4_HETBA